MPEVRALIDKRIFFAKSYQARATMVQKRINRISIFIKSSRFKLLIILFFIFKYFKKMFFSDINPR